MTAISSISTSPQTRNETPRRAPLSIEEERELAERYRDGDKEAGHRLVEANLPFVVSVAREYRRWGIPLDDIIQQGNIGLMKAVERFEPERGYRLITYAGYWIRAEIREYVVRAYRLVRIGTTKRERRALRAYRTTREENPAKLAELSGLSEQEAERLLPVLAGREASLDGPTASGLYPLDRMPSPGGTPEDHVIESDTRTRARAVIDELIAELSPREQLIAQSRWLLDEPVTLEQLGRKLGVSKERVRQLEARMRGQLRSRLGNLHDEAPESLQPRPS